MNEDNQDDSFTTITVMQRSPTFNREEAETLVALIEENKNIILNKSTNSITNHAKEAAWNKISKTFNSKGFKNVRTPETLKTKWENLKRDAKKLSKNILKCDLNEKHFLNQVIVLLNESDNYGPIDSSEIDLKEIDKESRKRKVWEGGGDETSTHSQADKKHGSTNRNVSHRSFNFSPEECNLLLKCIKSEKEHIFLKDLTGRSTKLKRNAWAKVTYMYNKLSNQKRSMKTLRTKFDNMRKRAQNQLNQPNIMHQKVEEQIDIKIKCEPPFEYTFEKETSPEASDNEQDSDDDGQGISDDYREPVIETGSPDPLNTILNGDSGMDSINNFGNLSQNKEFERMKFEILKNQLETSKIERQRIKEKVEAERREQESKALEMSMRLRTARLELAAAEAKLPPNHPASQYHYNEAKAREYMQQFTNT